MPTNATPTIPGAKRSPQATHERGAQGGQHAGDIERLAVTLFGGALALYGLRQAPRRLPLALLGGFLAYRGVSGAGGAQPVHVEHVITINRSPAEVYRFWRDFSNLPRFIRQLDAVTTLDQTRSHWVAHGPAGRRVEWDAEIFMEKENRLIAWRSLPTAQIANAGSVRFVPAPDGRGCEVKVVLEYLPPAGQLGRALARLLGETPGQQVRDGMQQLKLVLEADALATAAMVSAHAPALTEVAREVGR